MAVHSRGVVSSRGDASSLIPNPGDYVLVERGQKRWLVLRCPSGCGDELPINLDRRAGPAWRFYADRKGVSLFPSVVRETGCRSHFIIWNDRVLWCSAEDEYESPFYEEYADLRRRVIESLAATSGLIYFMDLAERLDAVPWAVLAICRELKRERKVTEGKGTERGWFASRSQ
jgi:hypothetical protein